jgi:hypothetical protein
VLVEGRFGEIVGALPSPTTGGDCDGTRAIPEGLGDAAGGGADADRTADDEGPAVVVIAGDGLDVIGPVESAAGTTTASANSAARATSGTSPTVLSSGKRSRQLGQNPESGVAT